MMIERPQASPALSLEVEGNTLKGVLLSAAKKPFVIERVFELTLPDEQPIDSVNPLYMSGEGQQLQQLAQSHLCITLLSSSETLVRTLDVKLKKMRDIDAVLGFQMEPLLPYPLESAILERILQAQTTDGARLTAISVRKESLQKHLAFWQNRFKIEPEAVTCIPAALAAFSRVFCKTRETNLEAHFVVHLGRDEVTCVIVKQGTLLASQSAPLGLNGLIHAYAKDIEGSYAEAASALSRCSLISLTKEESPLLHTALENWRLEITRLLYALQKQYKEAAIQDLLFTGEGASLPELCLLLAKQTNKTPLTCTPPASCTIPAAQLQRLAVPIGAALSALPGTPDPINLRQQEFAYPHPWKRLAKPLGAYLGASLLLAAAICLYANSNTRHELQELRQEYVQLLGLMRMEYAEFEKGFIRKHPAEETMGVEQLSIDSIKARLAQLTISLKEIPDPFPLQPNMPRVADVLAWLSNHTMITGNEEEGSDPLHVESLTYTLVKHPEFKKPQERYQAKVELEFSSPTAKMAREFHDALISPNEMVDPKGEVKWSSNRGKYRTSFYLKDKTIYPSTL